MGKIIAQLRRVAKNLEDFVPFLYNLSRHSSSGTTIAPLKG